MIIPNSTLIVGRTSKMQDALRQQKWQEKQRRKQAKTDFVEILKKAKERIKDE